MPVMPFRLQRESLRKIGEKLARDQGIDPVQAVEALDALDQTLTFEENRTLYYEELQRRGIQTVPEEEAAAKEMERYVGQMVEETPELKEFVDQITRELTVARTELGRLKERHAKLKAETGRFKELSEAERARLVVETEELKRGLEALLGGLPRAWVEELMVVFLKLPKATEEAFWVWLKENMDLVRKQHEAKVVAEALEPQMKEYLIKAPPPPPKPLVPPKPEAKFKIGDEVYELETGRKVVVRQQVWNELIRKWDYLIEDRGRIKRVSEEKVVPLPPLPVVPPTVRPPRVPAPRVPRAPPAPLEFVCPKCGSPLAKVTEITWVERVPVFEKVESYDELPTGKFTQEVRTTYIPPAELIFMCTAGEPQFFGLLTELRMAQKLGMEKDVEYLTKELEKLVERMRGKCPYVGMYFRVRDGRLVGPVPQSTILRQVLAPPPAPRRAAAYGLERYVTPSVEMLPEFKEHVEKVVGMQWAQYLKLDAWSKEAVIKDFASKGLRELK